jgi:hypothetical protein
VASGVERLDARAVALAYRGVAVAAGILIVSTER